MSDERGLFDLDERYRRLSEAGDPLEKLCQVIDFEMFRADLDAALASYANGINYRPIVAHFLDPIDFMVSGASISLFQALHPASRMSA